MPCPGLRNTKFFSKAMDRIVEEYVSNAGTTLVKMLKLKPQAYEPHRIGLLRALEDGVAEYVKMPSKTKDLIVSTTGQV